MTRREALEVLIQHAASDCQGSGRGIRTIPPPEERLLVARAILKVFREARGYEPHDNDFHNLGLPAPTD